MPIFKYLTDTNILGDLWKEEKTVVDWMDAHVGEVGSV